MSVFNKENKALIDNLRNSLSSRKSGIGRSDKKNVPDSRASRAEKMAELRSKVMSGGYGKAPQEDYSNNSREYVSSSESSDTETENEELEEKTDQVLKNDETEQKEQFEQNSSEKTRLHGSRIDQRKSPEESPKTPSSELAPEPIIELEPAPEPEPVREPVREPEEPRRAVIAPPKPPSPPTRQKSDKIELPPNPVGLENSQIADEAITCSGFLSESVPCFPYYARLNSDKCWVSDQAPGSKTFLQIDLGSDKSISHVATQGQPPHMEGLQNTVNRWVTAFYVQYSNDGQKWKLYKARLERQYMTTFVGNSEHSDIKVNTFQPPIESRFIRIVPTKTFRNLPAALRCELYLS